VRWITSTLVAVGCQEPANSIDRPQVVRLLDPNRGGSLDALDGVLFKLGVDLEIHAT